MDRKYNRDLIDMNDYKQHSMAPKIQKSYPLAQPFVDETRATLPAWTFREKEQPRWEEPFISPQANGWNYKFDNNIQTRIYNRDHYVATPSRFENMHNNIQSILPR